MTRCSKLFSVTFSDTRIVRTELNARSAAQAIRKAKRLYLDEPYADNDAFQDIGGDGFHSAVADEVRP